MISALEAVERLVEGNHRYISGVRDESTLDGRRFRGELVAGQEPFAVILGCADSRVPTELIFDQGSGELFVVRVAGNIVAPTQLCSIELAVEWFGTRLVVVLGHSMCGAVMATVDELERPKENRSSNFRTLFDHIRPTVEPLMETGSDPDRDVLIRQAIRANILNSANDVRHGSPFLQRQVERGELMVVGAEYSLETGVVDFFDGLP